MDGQGRHRDIRARRPGNEDADTSLPAEAGDGSLGRLKLHGGKRKPVSTPGKNPSRTQWRRRQQVRRWARKAPIVGSVGQARAARAVLKSRILRGQEAPTSPGRHLGPLRRRPEICDEQRRLLDNISSRDRWIVESLRRRRVCKEASTWRRLCARRAACRRSGSRSWRSASPRPSRGCRASRGCHSRRP